MMYFGSFNFVGRPIDGYRANLCLLTKMAARKLARAQKRLQAYGANRGLELSLLVQDCYRPRKAVAHFLDWVKRPDQLEMKGFFYPDLTKQQIIDQGYVAPISGPQHALAIYASKVISKSILGGSTLAVSAGDVSVAGNATVAGFRYFFPIFDGGAATQTITLGADYKRLEKTEATFPGTLGTAVVLSPIQYTPVSIGYSLVRPDPLGVTLFSATAKGYWPVFPGGKKVDFAGDPNDPFNKPGNRAGSTGKFGVVQASLDRSQPLPMGFNFALHADGQWASEPLVPAEQYFAGGADSVRGYIQSEAIGDHAVRGRAELTTPNLIDIPIDWIWQRRKSSEVKIEWKLAAFYDAANLWIAKAPAGQKDQFRLEGVGGGLRARLLPYNFSLHFDQGITLRQTAASKKGDTFAHFMLTLAY